MKFFPHDVPFPGSTPVNRAIEAATELTEAISNFKYASPLKDMPDEQLAGLQKLADIFQVSTSKIHKTGGSKETQTTIKQTTMVTPLPKKTIPVTRENNHESQAAVPRVTPAYDKEVHIIPLEETQEELVKSVPDPLKGKYIIPMEEDAWYQTQA